MLNVRCVPLPRLPHPFWARARVPSIFLSISVIEIARFYGFKKYAIRTDQWTDRRTDGPSYRDARMHLKIEVVRNVLCK